MKWPWQGTTEKRSSTTSFTDLVFRALSAQSAGTTTALTSASMESGVGAIARGFASATVENAPSDIVKILTPTTLSLMARNLVRRGEDLHLIGFGREGLELHPVGSWDIQGTHAESSWFYRCDLFSPSGSRTRYVPSDAVVHTRLSVDPSRPWSGVSPVGGWSTSTNSLHGAVENALSADMRAAAATVVPMPGAAETPADETEDPLSGLKDAIVTGRGKSIFVETTSGAMGSEFRDAPQSDWQQKRLGPAPPAELGALLDKTTALTLAALGVDPAICGLVRSDGTLAQRAYQRFVTLTLEPMARILESELRMKLDVPELEIHFRRLHGTDLPALARASKSLKDLGVPLPQIARVLDIDLD